MTYHFVDLFNMLCAGFGISASIDMLLRQRLGLGITVLFLSILNIILALT